MTRRELVGLLIAIGGSQLAGIVGALFTTDVIPTWYASLVRPEIAPPNWVFGPVWTTLYTLMGIAVWLTWKKGWGRKDVRVAVWLFTVHLGANSLWSIMFFGWQNIGLALAWIVLLWVWIVVCMVLFKRISKLAFWLMVPYISWVSFASYLNYSFWMLN